jgi:hypothetical protein
MEVDKWSYMMFPDFNARILLCYHYNDGDMVGLAVFQHVKRVHLHRASESMSLIMSTWHIVFVDVEIKFH